MWTVIGVVVFGICFFVTLVSYYYKRVEYKGKTDEELDNLNKLKSPTAWLIYTLILGFIVMSISVYSLFNIISSVSELNEVENEYEEFQ